MNLTISSPIPSFTPPPITDLLQNAKAYQATFNRPLPLAIKKVGARRYAATVIAGQHYLRMFTCCNSHCTYLGLLGRPYPWSHAWTPASCPTASLALTLEVWLQ